MDKRRAKFLLGKGDSGSDVTRVTIQVSWLRDMGLTKEDREFEIMYDTNKKVIILKKSEN